MDLQNATRWNCLGVAWYVIWRRKSRLRMNINVHKLETKCRSIDFEIRDATTLMTSVNVMIQKHICSCGMIHHISSNWSMENNPIFHLKHLSKSMLKQYDNDYSNNKMGPCSSQSGVCMNEYRVTIRISDTCSYIIFIAVERSLLKGNVGHHGIALWRFAKLLNKWPMRYGLRFKDKVELN